MVLLCLLSALLSYNVKRIIENWKDTKVKAVGKQKPNYALNII